MKFDYFSLCDHLPDPGTGACNETQGERHRMWVELGVLAEQLGYAGAFLGEHHASNYIVPSPQMLLAAIASRTSRIRLGTAVTLLPNNDPVRLAEDFATLDLISNGRAEIGFGSGLTEHTFRLFGQDITQSAAMAAENLELIQKLWNEQDMDWNGRFRAPIRDMCIEPRTVSGKALPISRAVARSVDSAVAAGRSGHRLMLLTAYGRFADVKHLAAAYRDAYCSAGHDPQQMSVAILAYVHVQPDAMRARDFWNPYIANYRAYARMLAESRGLTRGNAEAIATVAATVVSNVGWEADFVGDPPTLIEMIRQANADVGGADRLLCYFDVGGLSRADTMASMRLFAERVMPSVRDL